MAPARPSASTMAKPAMPESSLPRPPSLQMKPHGLVLRRYPTAERPVWPAVTSTLRSVSSSVPKAMESAAITWRPSGEVCMMVRLVISEAAAGAVSLSSMTSAASRTAMPAATPQSAAGWLRKLTTPLSWRSTPSPNRADMTSAAAAGMPRASRYQSPAMAEPSGPMPQSIPMAARGPASAMNRAGSTPQ